MSARGDTLPLGRERTPSAIVPLSLLAEWTIAILQKGRQAIKTAAERKHFAKGTVERPFLDTSVIHQFSACSLMSAETRVGLGGTAPAVVHNETCAQAQPSCLCFSRAPIMLFSFEICDAI